MRYNAGENPEKSFPPWDTHGRVNMCEDDADRMRDEEATMAELPTGTLTLLFSDMEGSTRLLQQLGEPYARALADCRHLLRSTCAHHHARQVATQGTPFFLPFAPPRH